MTSAAAWRAESDRARAALLRASVAAPGETTLEAVAERVGRAIAEAEPGATRMARADAFARAIREGRFWPSVPILSNAGRGEGGQLAACFVLEVGDSLDSIYETLRRAARIQQGSGGVGLDFSSLRPRGAAIRRSGGVSPGPIAFAELTAHSARINALAGRREGAHLVVLADTHPDVLAFVEAAREVEALRGAGLALGLHDALLEAARGDASWALHDPRERGDGSHALHDPRERRDVGDAAGADDAPAARVGARDLLRAIAAAIRDTGNPTLLFLDAIAAGNPAPQLGAIRATNPCGEQPLLPGESCVLGSLALPAFADAAGRLDLAALEETTRLAVRFLDDVVEVNAYPDEDCAAATRRTRKLGLGVMGLADLLLLRGEVYGSPESERTAEQVMTCIAGAARAESEVLARERGAYPAWRGPGPERRNASLLAIAPTGTLHLLAGCSAGIEPWLDPVVPVDTGEGGALVHWADLVLLDWLEARGAAGEGVIEGFAEGAPLDAIACLEGLPTQAWALLRRAHEVPAAAQLAMQARFQAHVDGAVSKTIHLPPAVSVDEIVGLIQQARALGCKGVALWRDEGVVPARCIRCAS